MEEEADAPSNRRSAEPGALTDCNTLIIMSVHVSSRPMNKQQAEKEREEKKRSHSQELPRLDRGLSFVRGRKDASNKSLRFIHPAPIDGPKSPKYSLLPEAVSTRDRPRHLSSAADLIQSHPASRAHV